MGDETYDIWLSCTLDPATLWPSPKSVFGLFNVITYHYYYRWRCRRRLPRQHNAAIYFYPFLHILRSHFPIDVLILRGLIASRCTFHPISCLQTWKAFWFAFGFVIFLQKGDDAVVNSRHRCRFSTSRSNLLRNISPSFSSFFHLLFTLWIFLMASPARRVQRNACARILMWFSMMIACHVLCGRAWIDS